MIEWLYRSLWNSGLRGESQNWKPSHGHMITVPGRNDRSVPQEDVNKSANKYQCGILSHSVMLTKIPHQGIGDNVVPLKSNIFLFTITYLSLHFPRTHSICKARSVPWSMMINTQPTVRWKEIVCTSLRLEGQNLPGQASGSENSLGIHIQRIHLCDSRRLQPS